MTERHVHIVSAGRGAMGPGEVVLGRAPVEVGEVFGFVVVVGDAVVVGAGDAGAAVEAEGAFFAAAVGEAAVAASGGDKLGGARTG